MRSRDIGDDSGDWQTGSNKIITERRNRDDGELGKKDETVTL